ncbi:MAG: site-2 protease family protein [Clostridia bacterium]|nr:site-2 protease family protein [Clostridia bacterium]
MILLNLDMLLHEPMEFLKLLACMLPVMLISLTLHEWGHAFAAHKCGDDTARNLGRMTMNPLKHIDPIGFVMILLVGFGWAKPVPVNPRNYRNYKRGEAIVSLAGVTMNLLLAIVFSVAFVPLYRMYMQSFLYSSNPYPWLQNGLLIQIIMYGVCLNLALCLFNLLPFYPLDGYHVFELIFAKRLPMKVFLFLRRYGQFILIGLLLVFRLTGFHPIAELANLVIDWLSRLAFKLL